MLIITISAIMVPITRTVLPSDWPVDRILLHNCVDSAQGMPQKVLEQSACWKHPVDNSLQLSDRLHRFQSSLG